MPLARTVRTLLSLAVLLLLRSLPAAAPAPLAAQCTDVVDCGGGGGATIAIEPDGGSWSASAPSMQVVVSLSFCGSAMLASVELDGQSVLSGFTTTTGSLDCATPSVAAGTITLHPGTHTLVARIVDGMQTGTASAVYTYTRSGTPPPAGAGVQVTPDAQPVTRGAGQRATERFTVANTGSAPAALSLGRTCTGAGVTGCTLSHAALTVLGGGIVSVGVNYTAGAAGSAGTVALAAWKTGDSAAVNDGGSRQVVVTSVPGAGRAGDPAVTTAVDRSACLMLPAGLDGVYECGDLRLAHALPATRVLSRTFAPTLLYSSQHAFPFPVVSADVPAPPGSPTAVVVTVKTSGATHTREYAPWASGSMRLAAAFDATGLPTGFHEYSWVVRARYADGSTVRMDSLRGTMPIVNRSESRFGRGWWMAGIEELKPSGGGSLMWIGGDGSTLRYLPDPSAAGRWTPERYAGTDTIVEFPASDTARYARVLTGGDTVFFDVQGRHRQTVNRSGQRTLFVWNGDALVRVNLPRGPVFDSGMHYALEYDNPYAKLSRVVAPGVTPSRAVTFQNTDGRVTAISGPDTTGVRFSYVDLTPRIAGRRDRRGVWTSWRYDQGSRLKRAVAGAGTPDSAVYTYSAQESRPLTASPLHLVYTAFDGPRPDTDLNDRSYFWVDRRGAPVEVKNALGFVTRLYREDPLWPGEVTRVRYPNGREVTSTLDEAGRLSSTTDWATSADGRFATTLYEWDARCGAVSRVTLPEGEVSSRGYDARCRLEWTQPGQDTLRRVTFGYKPLNDPSAPGLPASVTEPGAHTSTFGYDANGNLRFTTTPGNDTTTFVNDALGRVRVTRTPIRRAQNLFQTDSATYDLRDRVIRADSHGPRMAVDVLVTADSQRVVVETDYDPEGLARAVSRYTRPDPLNIDTLVTRWKHDALRRVTAEIAADSTPATWDDNPRDTTVYNPAGLPVWTRTRRGDVLSSRYDAAGRPVWRHQAEAVYDSTSWGIPGRQRISSCVPNTPVEHVYPWFPTDPMTCTLRIPADSSVFAYDEMGNLRRAANGAATVRRGYLANGLLAADTLEIRTLSGAASARAPYVLAYEYDLNGRRTGLAHPGAIAPVANAVTRYTYDPATGALASVTDPLGNLFSFRYDARGHLDTLALPGGMRQSYDYDGSGRLSLYRAWVPSVAQGALLSDVTFQYDERGKMLESSDAGLGREVMSARYSGLGHLVRSAYSSSGTAISGATSVNQTTATMSYDPLGNGYHTLSSTANQLPDHRDRSLSNRENSSAYLPLTGRLRLNWDQTSTTEFAYDRAGNTVFEMTRFTGANVNGRDRVSYYGGDGKLRVVDARTRTANDETATWEEYRYDALGRRVQVLTREWCTFARVECNHATVRRTVWDGDQALYEIRMMESEGDSDGTPSPQPNVNGFNLNPRLGRVLLTHGPGIDQPLSAIRMGYSDYYNDVHRTWPTFSVVPLWNQRGQAPFVAFGAGGNAIPGSRTLCQSSFAGCLGTHWLLAWDSYGARKNGVVLSSNAGSRVWLGAIMEDQQDASGLLYRRNRYYDPATGRFTQEDPIGLAGGLNLYGFANGDPVTYSDPYGLRADSVVFTGPEARRLWSELRGRSETMMQSGNGFAVLGGMLVGVLDAMESSSKTYVVSAIDYPDFFEESTGGGNARCSGNLCTIQVDTKTRGRGAHLGPLTILAHEAGGAYLQAEAGVDHHGPAGAVMIENFARGIFGCKPRNGHRDSATPCSR